MLGLRMVTVRETEVGLHYENGRYVRTLAPGRYRLWNWPWLRQEIVRVDTRRAALLINGQEMLTADALPVRLNVAVEYRVVDAATALHSVADYRAALYTALQLLLREEVQARTIDQLLAERSALSGALLERGQPEAAALGLELVLAGVKDVMLPAEVKRLLTKEVEAQRAGRAALVAAREEVAATRARANTAQLLAGNPVLLRLRELEALGEIADGDGNTVVLTLPTESLSALAGLAGLPGKRGDA